MEWALMPLPRRWVRMTCRWFGRLGRRRGGSRKRSANHAVGGVEVHPSRGTDLEILINDNLNAASSISMHRLVCRCRFLVQPRPATPLRRHDSASHCSRRHSPTPLRRRSPNGPSFAGSIWASVFSTPAAGLFGGGQWQRARVGAFPAWSSLSPSEAAAPQVHHPARPSDRGRAGRLGR